MVWRWQWDDRRVERASVDHTKVVNRNETTLESQDVDFRPDEWEIKDIVCLSRGPEKRPEC